MDKNPLPGHIAIIMDGNGRWASKRLMPRAVGHRSGANNLKTLTEHMNEAGYRLLTVYAFSTENNQRERAEVQSLMELLREFIARYIKEADVNPMRFSVIGDIQSLAGDIRESCAELTEITKNHTGLHIVIAINYGGRDEIKRAFGRMIKQGVTESGVTEELIESCLDTANLPAPDLLIRTGGEKRISNFLLWQSAYSEIYFTDTLWPDFNFDDLSEAVNWYNQRSRRFGR